MPTGIPSTTSIANWNRATQYVESAVRSGRYVNAESTLLFAGPPRISDIGGMGAGNRADGGGVSSNSVLGQKGADALYPIGRVESFGVQQAQTVQKLFEIGSRRSYQAGGRVQVVGNLGAVMINGPSLMRALYAYYPNTIQMANGERLGPGGEQDSVSSRIVGANDAVNGIYPPIYFEPGARSGHDPESDSEYPHSFWINLMSEVFSYPFGLGALMRDNRNRNVGALYLEDCMLTSHSFSVSATSTLITEVINFQADAAVPMEFSTLRGGGAGPQAPLLTGS